MSARQENPLHHCQWHKMDPTGLFRYTAQSPIITNLFQEASPTLNPEVFSYLKSSYRILQAFKIFLRHLLSPASTNLLATLVDCMISSLSSTESPPGNISTPFCFTHYLYLSSGSAHVNSERTSCRKTRAQSSHRSGCPPSWAHWGHYFKNFP